jgi:hypothetical protein
MSITPIDTDLLEWWFAHPNASLGRDGEGRFAIYFNHQMRTGWLSDPREALIEAMQKWPTPKADDT